MGYTHYWYRKPVIDQDVFTAIKSDFQKVIDFNNSLQDSRKVRLGSLQGTGGTPTITDDEISFNGIGSESHEGVVFEREIFNPLSPSDNRDSFHFVKTNRKPYDSVVIAFLIILKIHLKDDISISSDGCESESDFNYGNDLFRNATGMHLRFTPDAD